MIFFFFPAALNPEATGMYARIIYKFPFKISLDLQGRIRKPSKRKDGIDPLLPITPARPPKTIPPPPPAPHKGFSEPSCSSCLIYTP